jgi:hypothetical protein
MPYILYLYYTGFIIWFLIPLRQFRTRFFSFFLLIGIADLIGVFYLLYIDHATNLLVYILIATLALISLQEKTDIKKYYLYYIFAILIIVGIYLQNPVMITGTLLMIFLHILIILTLLKDFLNDFFNIRSLSVFMAVMIFYEITLLTKFGSILTGDANNYIYYMITSVMQILLGLFFLIFKYDYKRLILQLR